jgi:uncharacterized membrane protein HdeD (DUF308 family)
MLRSLSRTLLWRSLLALALGVIAIVWPGVTIVSVVVIFAVAAFVSAAGQGARAFASTTAGPVAGHLLLAVLDVAAGVVALAWPGITAWALTIWIAAWAVVTGIMEFGLAFGARETAGERAMYGLGGLLTVALGLVLFARPGLGAVSLAEVVGLFLLGYGIWSLTLSVRVRHTASEIPRTFGSRA